jgi:hypothetical protein
MRKLMMAVVAVLMSMSLAGAYAADDMKKGESKKSEQGMEKSEKGMSKSADAGTKDDTKKKKDDKTK